MEHILQKRTKIVATIGPASRDPAIMRSLFVSGVNVLRLNFSHGKPEDHAGVVAGCDGLTEQVYRTWPLAALLLVACKRRVRGERRLPESLDVLEPRS